jgi:FixJ family two-component response regulator
VTDPRNPRPRKSSLSRDGSWGQARPNIVPDPPPSLTTVFIVDDDPSLRRSLSRIVRQAGFEARDFPSAEDFLAARPQSSGSPSCLVLDLRMPGIGGLELQRELAADPAPCPVIFISGDGDIPTTVQAMKQGAVTFLPKPFDRDDLLKAIDEAVKRQRELLAAASRVGGVRERIDALSGREREVMAWVISGALNKQIAGQLGIVEQTVKVHRARVMEKMRVVSVADLVRLCDLAGFESAR